VLVARRVLLDQDTKVVWLEGDEKQSASAEQDKNHITAREVVFFQKSETHGEKVLGRGPGRLEVPSRTPGTPAQPAQPTVVTFGDAMTYLPDSLRAEFTGGVRIVDGPTTCLSKTVAIELAEGKDARARQMKRMVAAGGVTVSGDNRSAAAETLVYSYPTPGSGLYVATLTAKPGETCEIKSGDLLCRSDRIEMTETPLSGGKTALCAKAEGKGYIFYRPSPAAHGTTPPGEPFEVRYDKSGTFDDAAREAVFDGNVRVKRPDMNLTAGHVVMNFVKGTTEGSGGAQGSGSLDLSTLTAVDNVTLRSGPAEDRTTATGKKLVWQRAAGATELTGGDSEKDWARVVRDKSSLEAPVMQVVLKNDEIERVLTRGGGRLVGQTRVRQGSTGPKKLQSTEVTWSGDGVYRTFHPADQGAEPTAEARVSGNVKALSEDADLTSESLTVYFGPEAEAQDPQNLKLEARKVETKGNAHAKMFMPEGNYYRYARGDSLEWDRLGGRMVVMSDAGDAVVWDNSNEWTGKRLVVNQTPEGRVEAESTSGRRITFYEEGTPRAPSEDAREWKPIY
jgi:lipopolysaccharide export system protein LptA